MNILITNSVPLNGGDEALLIATILGIKSYVPEANITVLCNDAINARRHIDYVDINWDWEYCLFNQNISQNSKAFTNIRRYLVKHGIPYYSSISMLFSGYEEKEVLRLYRNADYIVSSAGCYIHDIYGYDWRMQAYLLALKLHKKLIFFGQSIGPFFAVNEKKHSQLLKIFDKAEHIYLREGISKKHLESIGYTGNNISVTNDVAFTLYRHYSHLFKKDKSVNNKIVVSFREWGDQANTQKIFCMARQIVIDLIEKGYTVTFISTCQGSSYYPHDDTKIAMLIKDSLPETIAESFLVDKNKYSPANLIAVYSDFNAYIGMRLHGAILAMLGGTPAFSVGYEDKTAGVYQRCGLAAFQADSNDDVSMVLRKIDNFLVNLNCIDLKRVVEEASVDAYTNFNIFNQ